MVGILVSCGDGPFSGAMFIFWRVTWCFFNPTSSDVVFSWSNIQSLQSVAEVRHAIPNTWKVKQNWSQSPNNQRFLHDCWLIVFVSFYIGLNHVCPKLLVYSVTGMMRSAFRYYLTPRSTPRPSPPKKKQWKLLVLAWRDMSFFLCSSLPVQNKTCANHEVKVKKQCTCPKINSQNPEIFLAACLRVLPHHETSGNHGKIHPSL